DLFDGKDHTILARLTDIRIAIRQTTHKADFEWIRRTASREEQTHRRGSKVPSLHFQVL
ncbi:MAG: hypothetical protein IV103_04875, partial [Zoogloea sp.]|nr:hypothetical protein [Zoogloea sp.]